MRLIRPRALREWLGRRGRGSRVGAIGLDLGPETLCMMQLEPGGSEGLRIRAAMSLGQPGGTPSSGTALRQVLREARRSAPFAGRRVVTALPPEAVKLMVLSYRLAPEQSEDEVVLALARDRIDEPIEGCVVDYRRMRTAGDQRGECSALVAVAGRGVVIEYLERLREAGLEVQALEIGPEAVARLVGWSARADVDANLLTIDCGRRSTTLNVFWGRRLILYREVDFGRDQLLEEIGKRLELDADSASRALSQYGLLAEASEWAADGRPVEGFETAQALTEIVKPSFYGLAEQVNDALAYTASRARGASVGQVYLMGFLATWPGSDLLVSQLLSIPAGVLDPLGLFGERTERAHSLAQDAAPGLALATGMALRGMVSDG